MLFRSSDLAGPRSFLNRAYDFMTISPTFVMGPPDELSFLQLNASAFTRLPRPDRVIPGESLACVRLPSFALAIAPTTHHMPSGPCQAPTSLSDLRSELHAAEDMGVLDIACNASIEDIAHTKIEKNLRRGRESTQLSNVCPSTVV